MMKKLILLIALGVLTSTAIAQKSTKEVAKMATLSNVTQGAALSLDELKSYEGTFELMPNFNLRFFVKKGKLISQATGQDEHVLVAQGDHVFIPTTFPARITFVEDKKGNFSTMLLSQGGQEMRASRIE